MGHYRGIAANSQGSGGERLGSIHPALEEVTIAYKSPAGNENNIGLGILQYQQLGNPCKLVRLLWGANKAFLTRLVNRGYKCNIHRNHEQLRSICTCVCGLHNVCVVYTMCTLCRQYTQALTLQQLHIGRNKQILRLAHSHWRQYRSELSSEEVVSLALPGHPNHC